MIKMLFQVVVLFLLARASFVQSFCTNSWAVEVHGGREMAKKVALKHGFELREKVGNLKNIYHFGMGSERMSPMSRNDGEVYTERLQSDPNVGLAIQQCLQKRSKTSVTPTDPIFDIQWYILNTGQFNDSFAGADHRIQRAWIQGLTGCGVTVAIVDDGLEYTHPDLLPNYAYSLGYDYAHGDSDPFPAYNLGGYFPIRESHGTQVAGIITAAKDNGVCGVGGAYDATLTGFNLFGYEDIDVAMDMDLAEGGALSHNNDIIDIYSNSWGPFDTGYLAVGPELLARMALEMGAKEGRNKKGVIFTFATGNGGDYDTCAANGYVNSIYTIGVGAVGVDGIPAYYDEICSAKLVSGYVENFKYSLPDVATTNVFGSCTEDFAGTSAATPIISSIVALTLEANPDLTWRDVQYLIVYTSKSDGFESYSDVWRTNGAGLRYNHQFGFGIADAEAMVTRAKHWVNVPPQYEETVELQDTNGTFENGSDFNVTFTYDGDISFLEHVVVKTTLVPTFRSAEDEETLFQLLQGYDGGHPLGFLDYILYTTNATAPKRGDIQVEMLSPMGTLSILLPYRYSDIMPTKSMNNLTSALNNSVVFEGFPQVVIDEFLGDGYIDWPFMSVHYWGEDPRGEWTLTFRYQGDYHLAAFEDLSVTLYGTDEIPEAVRHSSQCHHLCEGGCARSDSSEFCHSCIEGTIRNAETLECINECPSGFEELNGYCYNSSNVKSECERTPDEPPQGSCVAAGYESCCLGLECYGSESHCSCDQDCHIVGDCCSDIATTCPALEATLPYLQAVSEHGEDLPLSGYGSYENGSVSVPLANGFPYGTTQSFQIYVQEDGLFSLDYPYGVNHTARIFPLWEFGDTYFGGSVKYLEILDGSELEQLSYLIRAKQGVNFVGSWALVAEWRDIPEYSYRSTIPLNNTFQGALVTDGTDSYAVFTYRCGDLQWGDARIGFLGSNFPQVHRIINSDDGTQEVACANYPNEWSNLVYHLTAEVIQCVTKVDESRKTALLECSKLDYDVEDVVCVLPSETVDCSTFPVHLDISGLSIGETPIRIDGFFRDELLTLATASIVIPPTEIDLYFIGDTPQVDVKSIHVEFESNMNDLTIECHLKGRDKVDCSNGVFTVSDVSPGRHVIRVIARSTSGRAARKILRSIVYVPEDSESCRPHLINRGLNVKGNNVTLEFASTGSPDGFECILDRVYGGACQSPWILSNLDYGSHHIRLNPFGCAGSANIFTMKFSV